MENKFAVLVPVTNQVGCDTYKDTYVTIILSKKLNITEIMEKVHTIKSNATIEQLHFTEINEIN